MLHIDLINDFVLGNRGGPRATIHHCGTAISMTNRKLLTFYLFSLSRFLPNKFVTGKILRFDRKLKFSKSCHVTPAATLSVCQPLEIGNTSPGLHPVGSDPMIRGQLVASPQKSIYYLPLRPILETPSLQCTVQELWRRLRSQLGTLPLGLLFWSLAKFSVFYWTF